MIEKVSKFIAYFIFALILIIHSSLIVVNILSYRYGRERYGFNEMTNIIWLIMSLLFTILVVGWQYDQQKVLEKKLNANTFYKKKITKTL